MRGNRRVTSPGRGVDVREPREVLRRPHPGRRGRQARPGDRPRRRDPPGHPGAVAAYQEQPGPDRRARRRQDRRRRGPRPARSSPATCPTRSRAGACSASTWPRWWPARSTAASSRSGSRPCSRRSRTPAARSITFIDELHTVVGAGAGGDSAMDAGNMLKPMLARGELQMIGATTLDEYRERIEKDPALERRFQQVFVGEPSVEDTIQILRGIQEKYEAHHGVRITDAALVAAATLSDRYITGRQLPDKAIDLDRRGRVAAADGDRVLAGGDRPAPAHRRPAEDGGVRARQGDRRRVGRAARRAARRPRRPRGAAARRSRPAGSARRPRWRARARSAAPSTSCAIEADKLLREGNLEAAVEDPLRVDPRAGEASSPPSRRPRQDDLEPLVGEEVGAEQVAEVVEAWTGIPTGKLLAGRDRQAARDGVGDRAAADRAAGRRARGE